MLFGSADTPLLALIFIIIVPTNFEVAGDFRRQLLKYIPRILLNVKLRFELLKDWRANDLEFLTDLFPKVVLQLL